MSFFKDFKEDFAQAMNELMPDSNEMYDEDEEMEEELSVKETKKENVTANRKVSAGKEKRVKGDEAKVRTSARPKKQVPLKKKVKEEKQDIDDFDIAPEDLSDQIDDLLDNELYGDEEKVQMLIDDNMEVNTMDMSVDELLSQISEKQNTLVSKESVKPVKSAPIQQEVQQEYVKPEKDMGLEALLDSIANKSHGNDHVQEMQDSDAVSVTNETETLKPLEKPEEDEKTESVVKVEKTEAEEMGVVEKAAEPEEAEVEKMEEPEEVEAVLETEEPEKAELVLETEEAEETETVEETEESEEKEND